MYLFYNSRKNPGTYVRATPITESTPPDVVYHLEMTKIDCREVAMEYTEHSYMLVYLWYS